MVVRWDKRSARVPNYVGDDSFAFLGRRAAEIDCWALGAGARDFGRSGDSRHDYMRWDSESFRREGEGLGVVPYPQPRGLALYNSTNFHLLDISLRKKRRIKAEENEM